MSLFCHNSIFSPHHCIIPDDTSSQDIHMCFSIKSEFKLFNLPNFTWEFSLSIRSETFEAKTFENLHHLINFYFLEWACNDNSTCLTVLLHRALQKYREDYFRNKKFVMPHRLGFQGPVGTINKSLSYSNSIVCNMFVHTLFIKDYLF